MKKILLAEDDSITRMIIEKVLRVNLGYDVSVAKDGTVALEMLEKEHFDGILSDNDMPSGKSGIELLTAIRKDTRFKELPFILMSSELTAGLARLAVLREATMCLRKPFCREEDTKLIKKIFG